MVSLEAIGILINQNRDIVNQVIAGIILAVLGLLAIAFRGFLGGLAQTFWKWFLGHFVKSSYPRKTIKLITLPDKHTALWSKGTINDRPITLIRVTLSITNITDRNISIIKAILKKPRHVDGNINIEYPIYNQEDGRVSEYPQFPLRPHMAVKIHIKFQIDPPIEEDENKSFKISFVVVDQYKNESEEIKNLEVFNKL